MCGMPSAVEKRAACHCAPWKQADREVGARAGVVEGVEAALGELAGHLDEAVGAGAPGGHRVVLVQAQDVQELLLELGQRGVGLEVGVDELAPRRASGRAGSSS